jgi:hypothetical protein
MAGALGSLDSDFLRQASAAAAALTSVAEHDGRRWRAARDRV